MKRLIVDQQFKPKDTILKGYIEEGEHVREDGLAECLRKAADAVE